MSVTIVAVGLEEETARATREVAARLRVELRRACAQARAAGDERRAAELKRAHLSVSAVDAALAGRLKPGRRSKHPYVTLRANGGVRIGPDERGLSFTADELAVMLWEGLGAGFVALADWRARPRPARQE